MNRKNFRDGGGRSYLREIFTGFTGEKDSPPDISATGSALRDLGIIVRPPVAFCSRSRKEPGLLIRGLPLRSLPGS